MPTPAEFAAVPRNLLGVGIARTEAVALARQMQREQGGGGGKQRSDNHINKVVNDMINTMYSGEILATL